MYPVGTRFKIDCTARSILAYKGLAIELDTNTVVEISRNDLVISL